MKADDDKDTDGRPENQCDSAEDGKNGNSEDEKYNIVSKNQNSPGQK